MQDVRATVTFRLLRTGYDGLAANETQGGQAVTNPSAASGVQAEASVNMCFPAGTVCKAEASREVMPCPVVSGFTGIIYFGNLDLPVR
ncbi:MAG: hypothetical protein ACLRMZ_03090 [Blautia marasmi]